MIELTEPVPPLEIMKRMRYPCFESPPKIILTAETIQLQQKQDHRFTDNTRWNRNAWRRLPSKKAKISKADGFRLSPDWKCLFKLLTSPSSWIRHNGIYYFPEKLVPSISPKHKRNLSSSTNRRMFAGSFLFVFGRSLQPSIFPNYIRKIFISRHRSHMTLNLTVSAENRTFRALIRLWTLA